MLQSWSDLENLEIQVPGVPKSFGRVKAAFIHPEKPRLIAFLTGQMKTFAFTSLSSVGQGHCTLKNQDDLLNPFELVHLKQFGLQRCLFSSKKVLTKDRKNQGRVSDFTYDEDGNIESFKAQKFFLWWALDTRQFQAVDIEEITPSAIHLKLESKAKTPKLKSIKKEPTPLAAQALCKKF